jgi:threonine dehydratase
MADPHYPDLTLERVREAHARIRPHIVRTPVLTSRTLDALAGARLFFKCENFQNVGAFKARGATNAVLMLPEALAARGVATHSSGNHAAALARAARIRGIQAHIVMPTNAPTVKRAAVERYGGRIVDCEPTLEARETTAARVLAATGATFVHPYDDASVMAGQGTAALELLEDVGELDALVCPVGGGGLLAGTAVTAKALAPGIQIIAAEPLLADDAARSFAAGRLIPLEHTSTIADGLRTSLSEATFAVMRRHVDAVLTVDEDAIVAAMRQIWEILKIVVEPSGSVPYAAVLGAAQRFHGRRVGVILSGGNLDLDRLPWAARP